MSKFNIGDVVQIKKHILFSKGYGFTGHNQGTLHENTDYEITDYRKIIYANGNTYYEYFIGRKSTWVKESDIYIS